MPLSVGTVLQERYKIIKLLGAGGMGAVYEAYNERTSAYIALKETFATDDCEISAFEREAKLLANLDHEALPRVMDYFSENDGYFLVMELIKGEDLSTLLAERGKPFEVETVLGWADQLLDALEDLHSKGIIHRDIKPANIKLTQRGKIKLIDFGIAKGTAGELTKVSTINAATNGYAPLEQVLRANEDALQMLSIGFFDRTNEILQQGTDERSDIYALGATLYQLLTNRTPANSPTRTLAVWSGQADRLISVHQINPKISEKVSEVLQKAMHLDLSGRYQKADEMREAIKKVAELFEEIKTKPIVKYIPAPTEPSPFVKVEDVQEIKPSQRSLKPESENSYKVIEQPRSLGTSKIIDKKSLETSIITHSIFRQRKFVLGGVFFTFFFIIISFGINFFLIRDQSFNTLSGHSMGVSSVTFSPDGETIASVSDDDKIKLWQNWESSDATVQSNTIHSGIDDLYSVVFSPDGKTIAISGYRFTVGNTIKIWNISDGTLIQSLPGHSFGQDSSHTQSIAFSPDGKMIASGGNDNTVKLWEVETGKLIQSFYGFENAVHTVAFSPDGKTIAGASNSIIIWELASGSQKHKFKNDLSIWSIKFSPDGKKIVSGGDDKTVKIWDAETGALKQTLSSHGLLIRSVAFSPDGETIASGSMDRTIKLWDATSGKLLKTLYGHKGRVNSVTFSPDGKIIASASGTLTDSDYSVKLWHSN